MISIRTRSCFYSLFTTHFPRCEELRVVCGTQGVPDTVAPFRAWRGSRDLVAQSPKLHAPAVAHNITSGNSCATATLSLTHTRCPNFNPTFDDRKWRTGNIPKKTIPLRTDVVLYPRMEFLPIHPRLLPTRTLGPRRQRRHRGSASVSPHETGLSLQRHAGRRKS